MLYHSKLKVNNPFDNAIKAVKKIYTDVYYLYSTEPIIFHLLSEGYSCDAEHR